MKEDDIGLLNSISHVFHVLLDAFLEDLLVLSTHLRTSTCSNLCVLVLVQLAPALLTTAHVLGLRLVILHNIILIDLQGELAAVAEDDHPRLCRFPQDAEGIEAQLVLMLLDAREDLLLSSEERGRVTEVDRVAAKLRIFSKELELVLFLSLVIFIIEEPVDEAFVHSGDVSSLRVEQADSRLVIIESVELFQEFVVVLVF
mmetsp:Transcript_35883/g.55085  ORF Transcript_35883/g.55085 Transcript_35883/m.55085 type:complete len:201 (+) Transcript_35883:232-834(+)